MTDAAKSRKTNDKTTSPSSKAKPSVAKFPKDLTDATSQALYSELLLRRSSLAETAGVPVYRITTNPVLVALAMYRPADKKQLLAIKGIGPKQEETYGSAWLETISLFMQANGIAVSNTYTDTEKTSDLTTALQERAHEPPSTPDRIPRRQSHEAQDSSNSSPAFGSPVQRTPQLHTGLSFTMAETNLDEDHGDTASSYSDDSLPSLDFGTPPTILTPQLKRKRTASPCKDGALTASQRLQRMTKDQDAGILIPTPSHAAATPKKNTIVPNQSDVFTPRTKLARNKLSAFSKLVTNKLPPRAVGAPPIVSERTLSLIVVRAPQTLDDLERIPGIDGLILACQQTDMDLLKHIIKFAAVRT
jgi:hypothetical protein